VVRLEYSVNKAGVVFADNEILFTIPGGFIPRWKFAVIGGVANNDGTHTVKIEGSGQVWLVDAADPDGNTQDVYGCASWSA
jgi:hypothetical protein